MVATVAMIAVIVALWGGFLCWTLDLLDEVGRL